MTEHDKKSLIVKERPVSAIIWYLESKKPNLPIIRFDAELLVPEGKDYSSTFFMACGWHRGYLGMQANSTTEKRILFSVWDDGKGGNVDVLSSLPEAKVEPFGNEGTGMHAILFHKWATGVTQRFRVEAKPEPERNSTIYTGYYMIEGKWTQIASFRAPTDGKYLSGLYSFLENFSHDVTEERECHYGGQMVMLKNSNKVCYLKSVDASVSSKRPQKDFYRFDVVDGGFRLTIGGKQNYGRQCQALPCALERCE